MGVVRLSPAASRLVEEGVMTIFSKWLESADATPGEPVDIYIGGRCMATGLYEGVGAVGVRVLGWECGLDVEEVLRTRIEEAYRLRRTMPLRSNAYRLINAEGDLLPGLIVDIYNDVAVVQSSSMGMDRLLGLVAEALGETLEPRLIYARNDQRSRKEAGLPTYRGVLAGGGPPRTMVLEGDARVGVDVEQGQKTGLFLDQRDNRLLLASLVRGGEKVLDLYSYTGGFSLQALLRGASKAVLVEESAWAASEARSNLELNGVGGKASIITGRVEEFLARSREEFDVVVADPPAFIQSPRGREKGLKAYRALYRGLGRTVRRGGILVVSSCSYFYDLGEMLRLLGVELRSEGLEARILRVTGASMDHVSRPVDKHLRYLKTLFIHVA